LPSAASWKKSSSDTLMRSPLAASFISRHRKGTQLLPIGGADTLQLNGPAIYRGIFGQARRGSTDLYDRSSVLSVFHRSSLCSISIVGGTAEARTHIKDCGALRSVYSPQ
jgi:hypothetical protein